MKVLLNIKYFLSFVLFFIALNNKAQNFTVDGIHYQVKNGQTCRVGDNHDYTGNDVKIPASVVNPEDGISYIVDEIVQDAFFNGFSPNSSIINLDLSESYNLVEIGARAFQWCISLQTIDFSGCQALRFIGQTAFEYCESLNQIDFSLCYNLESLDVSCFRCDKNLESVTFPNGYSLKNFQHSVFYNCNLLNTVDLSVCKGLQSLSYHEFSFNDSLYSIILPESLTKVTERCFVDCPQLKHIICYAATPPQIEPTNESWQDYLGIFGEPMTTNGVLFVPSESIELYKEAAYWNDAFRILPIGSAYITLSHSSFTLEVGEIGRLNASIYGFDSNSEIQWNSNNPEIATVNQEGLITAISNGTAIITASFANISAECIVTVNSVLPQSVRVSQDRLTLPLEQSQQLFATIYPENTTDKTLTWISENPDIASVDNSGIVTGLAEGSTKIYVYCGEVFDTCIVEVIPVLAETISLNESKLYMKVNDSFQLTPTITPANTTDPFIIWNSDDIGVAYVDEHGLVTAISPGSTVITVYCGRVSAQCVVIVEPEESDKVELNIHELTLLLGQSIYLEAFVESSNAQGKYLLWYSDNPEVAWVGSDGQVIAFGSGVAKIFVEYGNASDACVVYVIDRPLTPSQMLKKGTGESCTFIVMMPVPDTELEDLGYTYIYGYTPPGGGDISLGESPLRYFNTDYVTFNNPENDFWVIAVAINEDGKPVPSERRHLDGRVDDDFDLGWLFHGSNSRGENELDADHAGVKVAFDNNENVTVSIHSISGELLYLTKSVSIETVWEDIDAKSLSPGLYVLHIQSGAKSVTKKIRIP